ncbi:MAG: general secretion pathway protein GspB [Steroidobacteraceae bacterium]|nr:general secretion pathway protein GspB [Steroidobacteraceae bacterium]
MSFILDALRKSELERQRQSGPSIAELPVARDDRRLPVALVAIGVLLIVNVTVLAYFLLRDDAEEVAEAPAAAAITAAAPVAAAAAPATAPRAPAPIADPPPAGALAAEAGMPAADPYFPASRAPGAPDPTLLPEAPFAPPPGSVSYSPAPPVTTLPPQATAGLAELNLDLHIFSADPAKRAVFVNGRRYTEGMALAEGPMVEEITRDGVVVNHRGQRFLLPRN